MPGDFNFWLKVFLWDSGVVWLLAGAVLLSVVLGFWITKR